MTEKLYDLPYAADVIFEYIGKDFKEPSEEELFLEKPMLFKLCGPVMSITSSQIKKLKEYGDEFLSLGKAIIAQSKKINLLQSVIVNQSVDFSRSIKTKTISGNRITVDLLNSNVKYKIDDYLRVNIFIIEHNLFVYCYGKVSKIEEGIYTIDLVCISNEDREMIVQTSFEIQRQLLAQRRK
ncbi:MAG: hypothetical protein ACI4V7_08535 [Succinivibrionaceae bacterium]